MRQLAAIVFADMAGYTALMQENEGLAIQKRQRLKIVLEETVARFNGKILQYYGDGSLSIFNSAIDAVECSISLQQQLQQSPKIDLRIGIHTGDVNIDDGAVYGDGVNLASRIESLAVPGAVFISDKVHDDIRNKENIKTKELGYFELKNVRMPVRVFAVTNNGIYVPSREEIKGKTKPPANRLAVLPFVNMSADVENEYFSDGITEELLNALTRVEGLQVTSRTSAFAFKGKNDDIRDIAIKLNVDKVLEGSVRKAGNRVRITAQLINAADGYHIWSENYDRNLTDIFEVQDEISTIIANRLRENLTTALQEEKLVKTSTHNVEAYTHFLKGMHFWNKVTPADYRKGIECFKEAISIEPRYAQAYAMMAACYSYLGAMGQMQPGDAFELVREYAAKALELDDQIAEGYIAKARADIFYYNRYDDARQAIEKALQLNSAATEAYCLYAIYYVVTDQKEKALEILEKGIALDPLSPNANHLLGEVYAINERYEDACRLADKLLEINPELRSAIELKGWCNFMQDKLPEALAYFKEVYRLTNHPLKGLAGLGCTYAKMGDKEKVMEYVAKMEQRHREDPGFVIDGDMIGISLALGDIDKTFYHIEKCVEKKLSPIKFFLAYPAFKELKKDPRYNVLMKRLKENTV